MISFYDINNLIDTNSAMNKDILNSIIASGNLEIEAKPIV